MCISAIQLCLLKNYRTVVYKYVLSNVYELKQIKLYQLTGTIFSIIAYEKIPGLSRIPNIAYYCLTQGALVMQPIADFNICIENQNHSIEERVKLLLNGGLKMVIDRVIVHDKNLKTSNFGV